MLKQVLQIDPNNSIAVYTRVFLFSNRYDRALNPATGCRLTSVQCINEKWFVVSPSPTLGSGANTASETSAPTLVCDRTPHHNFLDILANNWRNERHRYIYL